MARAWSKQTIKGTVQDNWPKIESFLNRLNVIDANATKVVESGDNSSGFATTVIYPVITALEDEVRLED